jgi:hypothetical protein
MNTYAKAVQFVFLLACFLLFQQSAFGQRAAAELISSMTPPSIEENISVKDGERFVTYHNGYLFSVNFWIGIQIWDISNVKEPKRVSFLRTDDMVYHVNFYGDKLFAANKNAGIIVFDISDIYHPYETTRIQTPGDAYWIDIEYPYLFVAMGNDGFCVIDINNLNDPRTISLEILENWVWSIDYQNEKLYLGAKQGGFVIYDASNLSNLVKITQYKTGYHALQFQIEDNIAYIADGPGGLLILDISAPKLPKELGRFSSEGFSNHVFKSGNYAYLSNRELGLLIVRVSDPTNPELEARYISESETYASFKEDVYVFLSTDTQTEILRHNNQPVLKKIDNPIIDENFNFVLQLQANDPDGDQIYFEAENLPEGSLFNTETGLFTWTPTFQQSGIYPNVIFTVIEKTGSQLSTSDTITITVNHVNRSPELPAIANVTIAEDSMLIIQVPEGSDPDSEDIGKLFYRVENTPEGVEFDSVAHIFKWKPTFEQSGTYIVDFVLEDGSGGADREAVTVTVQHVDRPPIVQSVADQTVNEGDTLKVVLSGEELDSEDLDKISFMMKNLPEGASFNPATREFSWMPTYDQSGNYPNVTAIMQAGRMSDTTFFNITVNHVNRPPVLAELANQSIDENARLQIQISGSDPDVEDAGKLTYRAENLPMGASFNSDSLLMSWIPTFEQSGTFNNIIFTVTDPQGLSDQKSISISVNHVNRPPVLAEIPPLTVDENVPLQQQLSASDPDSEDTSKLVYSSENLPEGAILDATTGMFSWTPTYDQSGNYEVTFTISDGVLTDSKQTNIKVNHINRPPTLTKIEDQAIDENQPLTFNITADDPDSEDEGKLTYTAQNLPEGAIFDPNTQSFSWTPTYTQSGIYNNIIFQVADSAGLSDQKSMTIIVRHVNRAPELSSIDPIISDEQQPINFTLVGSDPDQEDAGKLTYQISNLPVGATLDPISGKFTWTPSFEQSGEYTLNATVSDSVGSIAETSIQITVNHVNRPPTVTAMEPIAGNENEPLTIRLDFSDPDNEDIDKLQVSSSGLPEASTLDPATGIITWTPTFEQSGDYIINYTVTDSYGETATGTVSIQIQNINRPPSTPQLTDIETSENEPISTNLPEGTDPDSEDQGKLQYRIDNLPQGASFNASTRSLQWIPTYEQAGSYTITYTVTDIGGLTAQTSFNINVLNINRPPTLIDIDDKDGNEGQSINFTLPAAEDPDQEDAGNIRYSLDNLPDGANFNASSRTFSWTPRFDQAGNYSLTFLVQDEAGESDQRSFTISVNNVNQNPEFRDIGSKTVKEGEELSFSVEAEDRDSEDQNRLNYSAENLPSGANFNAGSRTFNWIPREDQQGTYEIRFTVSDGQGGSAETSVRIVVEDVPQLLQE